MVWSNKTTNRGDDRHKIEATGRIDVNNQNGLELEKRGEITLVARNQACWVSLRWLLTVRVFQAKSF